MTSERAASRPWRPAQWLATMTRALPQGATLPDAVWARRHKWIGVLLWMHLPGIYVFALILGEEMWHAAFEAVIPLAFAAAAILARAHRRVATVLTALGLLTCSAILVHLSGGLIEMHFHFFVMVGVVTLYQDWWPFLAAIGYVVLQHGVAGALSPVDVFNHPAAIAHPWRWAGIHGVFILGMSAAGIVSWRLNEALLADAVDREQRLAEAQRLARLGSWEWDLQTGAVTWSDEMFRLGGFEPGAFAPTRGSSLARIHPDDRVVVRDAIVATERDGAAAALDFRIVLPDDTPRWVHGRWAVTERRDGQPVVISGTSQDVSERHAAEAALRSSEEHQRETLSLLTATLDSTADGILVVDREGKISSFNRQFAAMWRLPESLLATGDDDAALAHVLDQVVDAEAFIAKVRELYAQPQAESHDTIAFRDGRSFERYSKPQLVDGTIVGRVWSFRDVTERKRLEDELAHQAFHDPLTNLANKALFRDRVEHALALSARTSSELAVVFIDLDHFKMVNDSLGHTAGDKLLTTVAERIARVVREGDTAARLGGDEFAILIEDAADHNDVLAIVDRMLQTIRELTHAGGREITVTASMGIAFGAAGVTVDKLLANADLAMYTAKAAGRNRFERFEADMHRAAVEHLELVNDLRRAAERDEIVVHYQPIVELESGSVLAVEALMRWQHPTRGLLAPAAFIAVAEETGIIDALGSVVLRETCRQLREWDDAGIHLNASVNLSAHQLANPDIVDEIATAVGASGVHPDRITLELTESALMENTDRTVSAMAALKALGFRLAVDDFGTGYSSLSYLQHFPIDVLKIDRSFIADIGAGVTERSLAHAIVSLATSLGLTAVAEGVETADQRDVLGRLGCPLAQGYFYSRPVPAATIAETMVGRLAAAL